MPKTPMNSLPHADPNCALRFAVRPINCACGRKPRPEAQEAPKSPEKPTKEAQLRAALAIAAAVLETVREAGSAPEGILYTALMEKAGFSLQDWEILRGTLLRTGLVRAEADQLCWVGPKLPKA